MHEKAKNCLVLDLTNVLLLGDGHGALGDDGTTLNTGSGNDGIVGLDTEDSEALTNPVETDVGEDNEETDKGDDEGDASVGSIGNSTLDGGEDGTTGNSHDEDTGTTASVDTKVGSSHGEDGGVHGGHEEVDGHDGTNGTLALAGADVSVKSDGGNGVKDHDEAGRQNSGETGGDEATDGEGDQSVGEEVGSLSLSPASVVDSVVDEESTDGNLGTDVAELGDETADHVGLLPDATLTNGAALKIVLGLDKGVVALGLLSNLRELGEDEQDGNSNTETGNTEVDELNVGEVVSVLAGEESLGSNEGTNEGSNTVPGLAELETRGGSLGVTNNDGVGVGSSLKSGKTAGNDQCACAEAAKRGRGVLLGREMGSWPEHNSTDGVERETHKDTDLVTKALEDLSSDGREDEVTTTEVHDLETGRLELCDTEDILEMLVQDIEKTVRETPEEEERGDEGNGEDELLASEETTSDGGGCDGNTAACHCYDC